MKSKIALLLSVYSAIIFGLSGSDTLLGGNKYSGTHSNKQIVKSIELSDTFLVQSYGRLKSLNVRNTGILKSFDHIFNKQFAQAINNFEKVQTTSYAEQRLVSGGQLYAYWKLDLAQVFFNLWVKEATEHQFLNTEIGISLDQIISEKSSAWLLSKGIFVSEVQKNQLLLLKNKDSSFNKSVQAYISLRTGIQSIGAMEQLDKYDPLVYPLVKSITTIIRGCQRV